MTTSERCTGTLLLLLLLLTGCSKQPATEPAKVNTAATVPNDKAPTAAITIASLTPDPSQPLKAGSNVKLKVNADYSLPSDGGLIGVVIQGPDSKPIGSTLKNVPGGSGSFTTEIEFVVPKATNVVVHVPLYIKGESKSVQVANKQYQIAGK